MNTLPYGSLLCSLSPECPVKTAFLQNVCPKAFDSTRRRFTYLLQLISDDVFVR